MGGKDEGATRGEDWSWCCGGERWVDATSLGYRSMCPKGGVDASSVYTILILVTCSDTVSFINLSFALTSTFTGWLHAHWLLGKGGVQDLCSGRPGRVFYSSENLKLPSFSSCGNLKHSIFSSCAQGGGGSVDLFGSANIEGWLQLQLSNKVIYFAFRLRWTLSLWLQISFLLFASLDHFL